MSLCLSTILADEYVRDWLTRQVQLKEESITDWMLDFIASHSPHSAYYAFNRYEEGRYSGADWDWWLLGRNSHFKFRVQAKRLRLGEDHYVGLAQSNRRGLQIEMLINSARQRGFFPIYAFYARENSSPFSLFVVPADRIYTNIFRLARARIEQTQLLNGTLPLVRLFCVPPDFDGDPIDWIRLILGVFFGYPNTDDPDEPLVQPPSGDPGFGETVPSFIRELSRAQTAEEAQRHLKAYRDEFGDTDGVLVVNLEPQEDEN